MTSMNQQQEIIIKTSSVVFLKRLIFIEFFWALLTAWLSLEIDFPQVYDELQLTRIASFSLVVGIIATSLQILIVALAFITWYFDTYQVDRTKIVHQRGNFFGVSDIARTQTLTDVRVSQSRLGKFFNYGTLQLVTVTRTKQISLKNVKDNSSYMGIVKLVINRK